MWILTIILFYCSLITGANQDKTPQTDRVKPGAMQTELYLPLIANKNIGVVANSTSKINNTHLVDSLISSGIALKKIFTPEHGFSGTYSAGQFVDNSTYKNTGIPVISLYGNKKKPNSDDMAGIDIMLFDLQDVGVRFYTYLSTLHYIIEACSEHDVALVLLDRPNPNGFYIDGPVLEKQHSSFVGLHPVPVVYGMTIGEYALMIKGEKWISGTKSCSLQVITLKNYEHSLRPAINSKPSPNLPNMRSIYLYPWLAFFEGTNISVARGTDFPFQAIGSPELPQTTFSFTPKPNTGAKNPPHKEKKCFGFDLRAYGDIFGGKRDYLDLYWLLKIYDLYPDKKHFFTNYFDILAGTEKLRLQIIDGKSEDVIRASWQKDLDTFKSIRKKYLLYE